MLDHPTPNNCCANTTTIATTTSMEDTNQPKEAAIMARLGWKPDMMNDRARDRLDHNNNKDCYSPVRVAQVYSNSIVRVLGDNGIDERIRLANKNHAAATSVTVGDWLLLDRERPKHSILLERTSCLKRRAPGNKSRKTQLIAANLDTLFIVSSCNQDFNIARLERYVALALEANVTPVIVLTKPDLLTDLDPTEYLDKAQKNFSIGQSNPVAVVALDARGSEPLQKLKEWCQPGQTVAFVGMSGVGKSTLTNALMGNVVVADTAGIREDDCRGRHTTTGRSLYCSPTLGCVIIDTPGMRELQLLDVESGVASVFADLQELSHQCHYRDCQHTSCQEGCAIREAIEDGRIDEKRFQRWKKLALETASNTATLAQQRNQKKSKDKAMGKKVRQAMQTKHCKYND